MLLVLSKSEDTKGWRLHASRREATRTKRPGLGNQQCCSRAEISQTRLSSAIYPHSLRLHCYIVIRNTTGDKYNSEEGSEHQGIGKNQKQQEKTGLSWFVCGFSTREIVVRDLQAFRGLKVRIRVLDIGFGLITDNYAW